MDEFDLVAEQEQLAEVHDWKSSAAIYLLEDAGYYVSNAV
jgi:hypothetical protein